MKHATSIPATPARAGRNIARILPASSYSISERNMLGDILEREVDAEEARIRGVIRGIREILHRFGYLHRGYATPKADMLADIFDSDGLILCELVDRGILDRLPPGRSRRSLLLVQLRP